MEAERSAQSLTAHPKRLGQRVQAGGIAAARCTRDAFDLGRQRLELGQGVSGTALTRVTNAIDALQRRPNRLGSLGRDTAAARELIDIGERHHRTRWPA